MKWTAIARHRAGTTFVLTFFVVFAVLSGILVADAVQVYRDIDLRADSTHGRAVALLYLSGAARRADAAPSITVLEDGAHALIVRENGVDWQYLCRDGYLYKQRQGAPQRSAERLCAAGSLRLRHLREVIRADYVAPDGSRATLLLSAPGAGGAP